LKAGGGEGVAGSNPLKACFCTFRVNLGLAVGPLPIERDTRDESRKYKPYYINIILAMKTAGYTETRVLIYHTACGYCNYGSRSS